jgi:peptidoglycan/LPS O-acetylase OafA/YrhL
MAAIATGVLAAVAAHWWTPSGRQRAGLIGGGLVCYGAILFVEDLIWPVLGNGAMLVLTFGIAALLIGLDRPAGWRLPGTGWLQAFGRLSYEVYLTHMFVVFGALTLWRLWGGAPGWTLLLYPAALGASFGLGWLVARLITLPAERWLRGAAG